MSRTTVVGTLVFAFIVGCVSITCMSTASSAQVGISVTFGPPALPVFEQPICPGDGYMWTPGYWAWDPDVGDYYWVPGTWILAPQVGYLWTPPWWGWEGGRFWFHEGWWGPSIGFYGGINYGFGYFGNGFVGGRWQGEHFFYNREVTNINVVNIRNVYNERVTVNENRVSFNGGPGGVVARASAQEEAAARGRRIAAVSAQTTHVEQARANRELRASVNQGRPSIAATGRAGEFSHGAVPARQAGGAYHSPAERGMSAPAASNASRPENRAGNFNHPNELPVIERPAPPNTGNPGLDQRYKQQQDNLYNKQNQERQKLQAQQEKEHQQAQQRNYNNAQRQQMEQRHQQQTQQMQQRHQQQSQQLQQRQAPRGGGRR